jgi:glycosyltransferase involved in cell wall biosynthesis
VELIVIDDGSSDETPDVLSRYGEALTVLRLEGEGVYPARNQGIRHAQGELVAFLDDDDVWRPHRLALQVPLMADPEVGLVFGDAVHVRDSGHPVRTCFGTTAPRRGQVAQHLVWGNSVPTITVLARRACLAEAGLFATSHPTSADYLMWFRIALRHRLELVPEVVADYTVHAAGISADLGRVLTDRIGLFSAELARARSPREQQVLRRMVFNLSLSLFFAVVRGRARPVRPALRGAARGLRAVSAPEGLGCAARLAFARALR